MRLMNRRRRHEDGEMAEQETDEQRTSDSGSEATRRRKRPTYEKRREELKVLRRQVRELEAQAEMLRQRAGMPTLADEQTLDEMQSNGQRMQYARRAQLLSLSAAHAMLSVHLRTQFSAPLTRCIRLGKDPVKRREALLAMRHEKLNTAQRFIEDRLYGVDGRSPLDMHESWESDDGDFCCASAGVWIFEGVTSVKQVFGAFMFYMTNMEISISEVLGQLTLREDIDAIDTSISNHRLISSTEHGLVLELNSVSFGEYHPTHLDHNGGEFAVYTADCVDVDELYPYCPSERVRKDIIGAVSFSAMRWPRRRTARATTPAEEDEMIVVMRRCAYLRIERPSFEVSKAALADLRANVATWGRVMISSINATLYGER